MRSSSQAGWIASPSSRVLRPSNSHAPRRSFGSEYFLRLSVGLGAGGEEVDDGGVIDDGLEIVSAGDEKPARKVALPFLEQVTLPTWKSAPRRERDDYWQRIKDELFSLIDDRYLVDHCLFEPHELVDSLFKDEFLAFKGRLMADASEETRRGFVTQMGTRNGESSCTLTSLQHRLRLLVTSPVQRRRLELLKLDCTIGRHEAAQRKAKKKSEKERNKNADTSGQTRRTNRKGRAGRDKSAAREEKSPSAQSPTKSRSKSPKRSTQSTSNKKSGSSKVASKLRGALARGGVDDDGSSSSSESEASPRRPALTAFLRSEEEQLDAANLVRMEKEATARLVRFFAREGKGKVAKSSTDVVKSKQSVAPKPIHLQSDWLERCINLVLVRAGHRGLLADHGNSLSRRQKLLSISERESLEARERGEREASTVPGAIFLPPSLGPLASRPNSFFLAQGVLRDVLRISDRLAAMVHRGEYTESLHPHTGQTMLTVTLFEDDPDADDPSRHAFLARVFGWFTAPVLHCFFEYARAPFAWSLEKTARARVDNLAGLAEEQAQLRADLDRERDAKLNTLRDLQSTHQLRVVNELEKQMERDIARIRQAHLSNVAIEVGKIAKEFDAMQAQMTDYYAQEHRELHAIQRRVEAHKMHQFEADLARHTAHRESVINREHVARLALFAHHVEAHNLFDDCMEIVATHLPHFFHEPVFLSPLLPAGAHRLLFSHATLADLQHAARAQGLSCEQIEAAVENALANKFVEPHVDPRKATVVEMKQIAAHIELLQRTYARHPHQADLTIEDAVTSALTRLVSKLPSGQVCEADISDLESELQAFCEVRYQLGTLDPEDVRAVRSVMHLLHQIRTRACVRDELRQRTTMIHQVLMPPVSASDEGAQPDDTDVGATGNPQPTQTATQHSEQVHSVQQIIRQITKAYKGNSSMDATATLASMAAAEVARAPTVTDTKLTEATEEKKEEASEGDTDAVMPRSNRAHIALTLFRELARRVIAGLRLRAGWLEEDRDSIPPFLRLSQETRRITIRRPYRYGTMHSSIGFSRIDESLPDLDRIKHRWFFEVTVGPMDEGLAQVMIGFDIDAPQKDSNEDESVQQMQGMPYTASLRSADLMQREHQESLRTFERTQYDRFARALPLLAAATGTSLPSASPSAAESLARHIGAMLHTANEKAAAAQESVQQQLLASQQNSPQRLAGKHVSAAMSAAGEEAAQELLHFVPPAHLATHPAYTSSPAHLTQALLAQYAEADDPLHTPFAMFPTAAYQLANLSAPPPAHLSQRASGVLWQSDGLVHAHGRTWQVGVGFGEGDVIGCGLDLATHTIYFSKNGAVFMAAPEQRQVDRPHELPADGFAHAINEAQRGPVIGDTKFMHPRGGVSQVQESDDEDEDSDSSSPDHASASTRPKQVRLPMARSKKGTKNKLSEKKQLALEAAIVASAAAGTQVSLIDSPASSRPTTARSGSSATADAILRTPLHPPSGDGFETIEKIERGHLELQKRIAITNGAAAVDLPPTQTKSAATNSPGRPRSNTPTSSLRGPPGGTLTPLGRSSSPSQSPSSAGLPPRPRERNQGLLSSHSAQASLHQAQQLQLEHQLATVAVMQTAAAEALANAQSVYHMNQTKMDMLNAAIRAQTKPNAPAFEGILDAKESLVSEVRARGEGTFYADLDRAGGLPRLAKRSRARRMKRRAHLTDSHTEEGDDGVIDYTDVDASDEDDGRDDGRLSEGWLEHSSSSALHASSVLGTEVAGLPSILRATSLSLVPTYFARRFGVPILLPAPNLHLPALLSTQQLAEVLAAGVTSLHTSNSLAASVQTVMHASHQLLVMNQQLVRTALETGFTMPSDTSSRDHQPATIDEESTTDRTDSMSTPTASEAAPVSSGVKNVTPIAQLARIATAARDRAAINVPAAFDPSSNARIGRHHLLAAQERQETTQPVLVHGRTSYTLRPCICLYSAKPQPTVAYFPSANAARPSYREVGRIPPATGPGAYVTVNFGEKPFLYPIDQFRPVKNAKRT